MRGVKVQLGKYALDFVKKKRPKGGEPHTWMLSARKTAKAGLGITKKR